MARGTRTIQLDDFHSARLSSEHSESYASWLHESVPGEPVVADLVRHELVDAPS